MAFPPEAFIIGAQRSGTTSLAYLLGQHPDIELSDPKEPNFFTVNWDRGLDWYRSCFKRDAAVLLDASVSYAMARIDADDAPRAAAPRRILEISPRARFVYMVRDPAERCYSAYWHDVRAGREKRPLREAVEARAYYADASYYHRQLSNFLECFGLERFLIVPFREFGEDAEGTARRAARFFGAEREFEFAMSEPKNQSFLYNPVTRAIRDTFGEGFMKAVSTGARRAVPSALHPLLKRAVYDAVPALDAADKAWLDDWFREDAAAFARLTGVDPAGA